MLCIATLCAFAANAAAPQAERVVLSKERKATTTDISQIHVDAASTNVTFERMTPYRHKASANLTAEDYVGMFKWKGDNLLVGESWPIEGFFTISIDEERENGLLLTDFPTYFTTKATFEPSTGKLLIPNQCVDTYYDTIPASGGSPEMIIKQEAWFLNYTGKNVVDNGETHIGVTPSKNPFYFTMLADGNLQSGGDIDQEKFKRFEYTDAELEELMCIAVGAPFENDVQVQGQWYLMCIWITCESLNEYHVNMDDWNPVGDALFKDAWFPVMWDNLQTPQAYNVPLYRNNKTRTQYLLYNPYGPNTIYGMDEVNVSDADGYMIFDIADPYCVVFRPLVYSITINMMNQNEEMYQEGVYTYNLEGQFYYITGMSTTDIMIMLDTEGYVTSDLRASTRTITVRNPLIAYQSNPTEGVWWGGFPDFKGNIILPEGYNSTDGIESIVDDGKNGEPVYYNLQGVRVEKPEKGQLVIVRKGGKAEKMIVR